MPSKRRTGMEMELELLRDDESEVMPVTEDSTDFLGHMILPEDQWRRNGCNNPQARIKFDEVTGLTHWWTKDGTFYYPTVKARGEIWMLYEFDDYRTACLRLGSPEPERVQNLSEPYCEAWREFGGEAIQFPPIVLS